MYYAASENGLDFIPLNDGNPVIAADTICLSGGIRVFHFCTTTDLEKFTLVRETKTNGKFKPRHGSILPIITKEYERLLNEW